MRTAEHDTAPLSSADAASSWQSTQPFGVVNRVRGMSGDRVTLVGGEEVSDDPTAPVEHVDVVVPRAPMDREREFAEFMLEATPALARTAWLLCGDEHRAEASSSKPLMRTFVSWSTARERDPLAYTRRTLANLRIDTWRKHRRRSPHPSGGSSAHRGGLGR